MPTPPQRTPGSGGAESQTRTPPHSTMHSSSWASEGDQTASFTDFFTQALDGAMGLVHADGGEIATLDETRPMLVLRARRLRPLLDPAISTYGAPSRKSQPQRISLTGPRSNPEPLAHASSPISLGIDNRRDADAQIETLESQSTQLLPAALRTRTYGRGERLMGLCWQRGEPVVMRGEECRQLPGGNAPRDPDAAWHLAVPILRPDSLATLRPATEVIGVISVYNRDPLWQFSARDVELLVLHADRVARALRVAELSQQSQSQVDLLSLLGSDPGGSHPQSLYLRLRDAVRRVIDAPSFAVVLVSESEAWFELAERDGEPIAEGRRPKNSMPPWWKVVSSGRTLCISAPEDRALYADYCVLGWGSAQPAQSLVAAPLIAGSVLLGALVAASPRPDVYAPEHTRLFTSFARSAAILIQNTRLASESSQYRAKTHEKEQQLARLNNAILTLNASLDLDKTLAALVQHAKDLTEASVCAVFLKDGDALVGRFASTASQQSPTPLQDTRLPLTWREIGARLEATHGVLDHLEEDWNDGTEIGKLLAEQRIYSCLVMPVTHQETTKDRANTQAATQEKTLGALIAYTPNQRHHFWPEEIGLLSTLASQAGGAISNALLYQEIQQAYEEQKELDRLKQDFILQVSHEFRTPVTAIEGYVTLIGRHGHKLEQAKLDQYAQEIWQSTNQLMGMVNRLHDASSIGTEGLSLALVPIDVRAIAERAVADQAPEAKLRIELRMPEGLCVLGDAERLKAVFSNLLTNAVKYSPEPKKCYVTASVADREALARQGRPHALAEGTAARWVILGVSDEGEGISPEDQAKLFQKFVRLPRSLVTSVRGTGLGLWICRQYLDAMGGDIWVESELGKGALFRFMLPLASPPAAEGA
jgi:signal transduction histidine kinase